MGMLVYLNIDSSIRELENIEELNIIHELNEHGRLYMTAIIQEESKADFAKNITGYKTIEVVSQDEKDEYVTLFKGVVTKVVVHQIKGVYFLIVEGKTGSLKADAEIKSRSFQDKEMTYRYMVKKVISDNGGDINYKATQKSIEKFIMQYKETDWQFIKRMASHFNLPIVASLIDSLPKITFGIPQGDNLGDLQKFNYYMTKDIEKYNREVVNENKHLKSLDTVEFHIEIEKNFNIGDKFTYYDILSQKTYSNFLIKRKEIIMLNGALRFRYAISPKGGLTVEKMYNEKIVGLSLKGEVLKVIQDTVKVKLEIDDEQDEAKAWRFKYTTPYTAEGNSGFYIMPEIDDTVLIYFPNREEDKGVGLNSIRLKNKGTDKIEEPKIKYLRTIDGKEIKLAPEEIVITCCNWKDEKTGEENKIYIQLNEKKGITIQSTKPIHINSDADINITADKKIEILAEDEIRLKCKSSVINMSNNIDLVSEVIKLN